MTVVEPPEARPADGLAVDFVVESDRAQLREIVQRVQDGRLGPTSATSRPSTMPSPPSTRPSGQGEDDHPRSPVRTDPALNAGEQDELHESIKRLLDAASRRAPG